MNRGWVGTKISTCEPGFRDDRFDAGPIGGGYRGTGSSLLAQRASAENRTLVLVRARKLIGMKAGQINVPIPAAVRWSGAGRVADLRSFSATASNEDPEVPGWSLHAVGERCVRGAVSSGHPSFDDDRFDDDRTELMGLMIRGGVVIPKWNGGRWMLRGFLLDDP